MKRESLSNIGFVCEEHRSRPGGFTGQDPVLFLGRVVKLGFPAKNPVTLKPTTEHMWVVVKELVKPGEHEGHQLLGVLGNDPICICDYECGSWVAFNVDEIEAVHQ